MGLFTVKVDKNDYLCMGHIYEAKATSPQKWVSYSRPPLVDDLILYLDAPGGFAFSKKGAFIKVVKFSVKQRSIWRIQVVAISLRYVGTSEVDITVADMCHFVVSLFRPFAPKGRHFVVLNCRLFVSSPRKDDI